MYSGAVQNSYKGEGVQKPRKFCGRHMYMVPEGRYLNDVRKILKILDPLPPFCHTFTQPICIVCHVLGNPPPPSVRTSFKYRPLRVSSKQYPSPNEFTLSGDSSARQGQRWGVVKTFS